MIRLFLPRDAAALALGADQVARALREEAARRGLEVEVVRTGSRGAVWLEPLLEVETPAGRIGYGPVRAGDVGALFEAGLAEGGTNDLCIGPVEAHWWFAGQQRLTFARCGVIDPVSVSDYRAQGGFDGLARALALSAEAIVEEVKASGLRGRGGAGFPAGIKWNTVRLAEGAQKYIVCNADEGDSGTFADRMLMEGDPLCLVEGMAIAGMAVGATVGFVYIRSEYPHAVRTMGEAIAAARAAGWLGADVGGSGRAFDMKVRVGAGAYICGEETSLLESLEGRRGQVRAKPPLPAIAGLFGKPTVVNNVLSLAAVPWILAHGGAAYAALGMGRSLGTLAVQLAGNVARGGLIEMPFGATLRSIDREMGRWHRNRPSVPRRAGRRPAGRVLSGGVAARYGDGLRGLRACRWPAGSWRRGGVRRFRQSRPPGAVRIRVLCRGKLRKMHAVPDWRGAWAWKWSTGFLAGVEREKNFAVLDDLVSVDDGRVPMRDGRPDAGPCHQCIDAFSRMISYAVSEDMSPSCDARPSVTGPGQSPGLLVGVT